MGDDSVWEGIWKGRNVPDDSLESRIVLISGFSKDSRELAGDMLRDFSRDHRLQGRTKLLQSTYGPYPSGDQNFPLKDPDGVMEDGDIAYMLKNSISLFISKPESPFLADPFKYILDDIVGVFAGKYADLRLGIRTPPKEQDPDVFLKKEEQNVSELMWSYLANHIPKKLFGVAEDRVLDKTLIPLTRDLDRTLYTFRKEIASVHVDNGGKGVIDPRDPRLDVFKHAIKGYLSSVVRQIPKVTFHDELFAITKKVKHDILQDGDIGKFLWVLGNLDGRSDGIKYSSGKGECIRAEEPAMWAKLNDVDGVYMFGAHSQIQLDFFQRPDPKLPEPFDKKTVKIYNLTKTNETISYAGQLTDLSKSYVGTPDIGGLEDAFVFARDLKQRSRDQEELSDLVEGETPQTTVELKEFSGYVLALKKERLVNSKVSTMKFLALYQYNPANDTSDVEYDKEGKPIPYDILHPDYKKKGSDHYIGKHFDLVCGFDVLNRDIKEYKESPEELAKAKEILKDMNGLWTDDITDSGGTLLMALDFSFNEFNSKGIAQAITGSLTGDAISNFDAAYRRGNLLKLITSTNVMHPNQPKYREWWHLSPISDRFKNSTTKNDIMPFLSTYFPTQYKQMMGLTYTKRFNGNPQGSLALSASAARP
jgi:phosphoribosylpyrophosphate synthetase